MTRTVLSLAILALLAGGTGSAVAQTPTVPTTPTPPPAPPTPAPAPPAAAKATIHATGGLGTSKARYYAPFQQVTVKGRVKPAVKGEIVRLRVVRKGKVVQRTRRRVGNGGRFTLRFKVGKPGRLRLVVDHAATATQVAFRAPDERINVVRWQNGAGANGIPVLLLQRALWSMGFVTPVTGSFDDATARAVLAFRKTNDMERTGYASSDVYAKLFRGQGAYKLRYPKEGKHVEYDWSRQVLVLARNGKPERVYHSSSGAPATPTVFGKFNFYLQTPGTNSVGMVHSSYFIRGYAIHGYASVPNYPASHGCLRVPIPNAAEIFEWVDIGDPIWVYR